MANAAEAVRVVEFEIRLNGQPVLAASTGDQGEDANTVWRYLRELEFRVLPDFQPQRWQDRQSLRLQGDIVLEARYGGRARLDELTLLPTTRGWRVHPGAILQTFRTRKLSETDPIAARPNEPPSGAGVPRRIVIAHRGASGYLPEHTLPAASQAYGLGADYIEQDIVLSKDRVPIVLHDIHLDTVTNVAERFPSRARADGRWYAIDFTLTEIKSLQVHERTSGPGGQVVFANRFPWGKSRFEVATLAEMIELVQGLNQSTGRQVGIYPELKHPAWHLQQGYDLSAVTLNLLAKSGYRTRCDAIFVQCFDAGELQRIRSELSCELALIQLLDGSADADRMWTESGLAGVAKYADAVGPNLVRVLHAADDGTVTVDPAVEVAHRQGLVVHPFTLRRDDLPAGFTSLDELVDACVRADVDGFFSDFADRTRWPVAH
jgi:glycerophosphoryl diester phosphodiesterase